MAPSGSESARMGGVDVFAYRHERKCEYCEKRASRASHDGSYFCNGCAMPGDMYLRARPKEQLPKGGNDRE